jgi:hypothetical protein
VPPLESRRIRPALKAERVGFEPTVQFPGHGISSAAQSTTLSPLRRNGRVPCPGTGHCTGSTRRVNQIKHLRRSSAGGISGKDSGITFGRNQAGLLSSGTKSWCRSLEGSAGASEELGDSGRGKGQTLEMSRPNLQGVRDFTGDSPGVTMASRRHPAHAVRVTLVRGRRKLMTIFQRGVCQLCLRTRNQFHRLQRLLWCIAKRG